MTVSPGSMWVRSAVWPFTATTLSTIEPGATVSVTAESSATVPVEATMVCAVLSTVTTEALVPARVTWFVIWSFSRRLFSLLVFVYLSSTFVTNVITPWVAPPPPPCRTEASTPAPVCASSNAPTPKLIDVAPGFALVPASSRV
ncbi:hypothetical protein AWB69_08709 [Caballeronia udeis]|uniref:Uncharacterized protein n=1 Tax=Caballeronia udeis TaxID=1232866 RepID=A0A158JSU5_9BURK|nr:hypothetical protein AWB69_08709 [Caballeronia udeis]